MFTKKYLNMIVSVRWQKKTYYIIIWMRKLGKFLCYLVGVELILVLKTLQYVEVLNWNSMINYCKQKMILSKLDKWDYIIYFYGYFLIYSYYYKAYFWFKKIIHNLYSTINIMSKFDIYG